jgi:lipopolysaccharide/colanic/teichoic acid biosynthesis glycosyltransferase
MFFRFVNSKPHYHTRTPDKSASTCRLPTVEKLEPLFIQRFPRWKRALDIVGSLCGLFVLSPLFVAIGVMIKAVSPGPIYFKQQRVGRGGTFFSCLKFRTMKLNADSAIHQKHIEKLIGSGHEGLNPGDPMEKLSRDPRVILGGNLLRSTGLDELPQLINVLLGEMSLVGPRPPIPYEVAQYPHWYRARFDILPGLTGLWQVSGKNRLGFNEMIRLDIKYAMQRSFFLDCKILFLTPYAVFRQVKDIVQERETRIKSRIIRGIVRRLRLIRLANPEE